MYKRQFKNRVWSLRHLKRNGFTKPDLVKVYAAMVRPVAEYCSSVFHTLITASDSHEFERIQMQALKSIFGWRLSYRALLERSGLERLDERRKARFLCLADKMSKSSRYASWFPLRLYRNNVGIRHEERYKIYWSSSERYLDSPLNAMRRELNKALE